ncbi:MAG: CoA-binding protein [Actinobacteria bacterium]|nr:CoA-binding protein [Actinomycetota bacterium]
MPADPARTMLGYARRIAVVGVSDKPWRDSHSVSAAMLHQGYDVVPVNPNVDEVFDRRVYPSLRDVPGGIDVVNVFRRASALPEVAREAVEIGARGVWVQLGLRSPEARRIVEDAGLDYVEDRCIKVEVSRFRGELELPPER